eukprot:COSAG01_NODE_11045_length_2021_cov_17.678460_2_plen_205_part_00
MQGLAEGNEKIVELSNGCMCCGMKDDLLRQIYAIAQEACYDVLVVEGSGVAEPMPIAEGIASYDIRGGATLDALVKLDTLVTVVDAPNFIANYYSEKRVAEAQGLAEEAGEDAKMNSLNVASLLVEQVEFSNVIVLNKCSEVRSEVDEWQECARVLRWGGPVSEVVKGRGVSGFVACLSDARSAPTRSPTSKPSWLASTPRPSC